MSEKIGDKIEGHLCVAYSNDDKSFINVNKPLKMIMLS